MSEIAVTAFAEEATNSTPLSTPCQLNTRGGTASSSRPETATPSAIQ